jgi:hypothetical protein
MLAGEGESLIVAAVKRGRIDEARAKRPSLSHMRSGLFSSKNRLI